MRDNRSIKVFFFGDSICFGQGISPHRAWVTRVAERLASLAAERSCGITVQNPSVNGNTTRQALERIAYDVQSHEPDVLVIQFGMNDCNCWATDRGHPRVSPSAFAANLSEMVERARRFDVRRVVLLTNHPSGRTRESMPHTDLTYESNNRRYNALIREVADRHPETATLIDVERAFDKVLEEQRLDISGLLLADQLHLELRGHDLYFETVTPKLEPIVLSLLKPARGHSAGFQRNIPRDPVPQ